MPANQMTDMSYFPGCSLDSTAHESNHSLTELCGKMGINLLEIEDWNCCGSSSAHSINPELALDLAARNLFRTPTDKPLVVACPNCIIRLREAHLHLKNDEKKRHKYEEIYDKPYNSNLRILHFLELLENINLLDFSKDGLTRLEGFKFVTYYGCMLARPFELRGEKSIYGIMEKTLSSLGAVPLTWLYPSRCCGTFLSVAKPDLITEIVNEIIQAAIKTKADCIVTACAMCQLNLEVRCSLKATIPIMHFSEIIALALGESEHHTWFQKHLVDPRPMLMEKGLV